MKLSVFVGSRASLDAPVRHEALTPAVPDRRLVTAVRAARKIGARSARARLEVAPSGLFPRGGARGRSTSRPVCVSRLRAEQVGREAERTRQTGGSSPRPRGAQ